MSRTGTAARLFGHVSEAVLGLQANDMRDHGLKAGDLVSLQSRRGSLIVPVETDDSLRPGQAFLPMHWGDRFLKGGVNLLTQPAFDPLSKQPELKHSGVRVDKIELPWSLYLLAEGDVQSLLEALRPLCETFAYVSLSLVGREQPALVIRAADYQAPHDSLLQQIDQLLDLETGPVMSYDDPERGISKRVRIDGARITAIRLAGDVIARHWLQALWLEQRIDDTQRRWLLAPISAPPGHETASNQGKTLCNCMNVSKRAVMTGIGKGMDLDQLKTQLGCGSMCGSCVPEIKRLLSASAVN